MSSMYDLAIAYRIYPGLLKNPSIVFSDNKLKLSKVCLNSFSGALKGIRFKMFVILDNCPEDYKMLFLESFDNNDIIFLETGGIGNNKTFELQINWLLNQRYSDNVYFAEDDYLYTPECFVDILDFFNNFSYKIDFLTPYDHPDYEELTIHNLFGNGPAIDFNNTLWTQRISTTCTFLTSKSVLKRAYKIFQLYPKIGDFGVWIILTKPRLLYDPKVYLSSFIKCELLVIWVLVKTLIYKTISRIYKKRFNLYSPNISRATHAEKKYLAKNVEWEKFI